MTITAGEMRAALKRYYAAPVVEAHLRWGGVIEPREPSTTERIVIVAFVAWIHALLWAGFGQHPPPTPVLWRIASSGPPLIWLAGRAIWRL